MNASFLNPINPGNVNSIEIMDKRDAALEELRNLVNAKSEEFTQEQSINAQQIRDGIAALDVELADQKKKEEATRSNPIPQSRNEMKDISQRYSLGKAVKELATGGQLTGLELEMHQEARNESAALGINNTGNLSVPSMLWRDNTVGTGTGLTQTATSGQIVPDIVSQLRPDSVVEKLGATVFQASGSVVIPVQTDHIDAAATNEATAATESDFDIVNKTLIPERVAAVNEYSMQLLAQNIKAIDAFVVRDINREMGIGVDNKILTKLIGDLTADATTADEFAIADLPALMEEDLLTANAMVGSAKFLMHPKVLRNLKRAALDAGSGKFAAEGQSIYGYSALVTTNKMAGTEAIFGDFADLAIAYWGGVDVLVDPYTSGAKGLVRVIANSHCDAAVRRTGSFSYRTALNNATNFS